MFLLIIESIIFLGTIYKNCRHFLSMMREEEQTAYCHECVLNMLQSVAYYKIKLMTQSSVCTKV